jgi:hypothetical protein
LGRSPGALLVKGEVDGGLKIELCSFAAASVELRTGMREHGQA